MKLHPCRTVVTSFPNRYTVPISRLIFPKPVLGLHLTQYVKYNYHYFVHPNLIISKLDSTMDLPIVPAVEINRTNLITMVTFSLLCVSSFSLPLPLLLRDPICFNWDWNNFNPREYTPRITAVEKETRSRKGLNDYEKQYEMLFNFTRIFTESCMCRLFRKIHTRSRKKKREKIEAKDCW